MQRGFCKFTVFFLILLLLLPANLCAQTLYDLPAPARLLSLSDDYSYPVLKGLKVNPQNPFDLEFIVDTKTKKNVDEKEAKHLISYFLAALTIPEQDVWVNLSPYEAQRIIPLELSFTDLGKDLLSQDYVLKQLTSSLTYPESTLGKSYWSKVYQEIDRLFGKTNITVNSFNKVWIVPDNVEVYENFNTALITNTGLKVMSERDYVAFDNNKPQLARVASLDEAAKATEQVMKDVILPIIEKEVNQGKSFAVLRQMHRSFILAVWFKKRLRESIYQNYIDQKKILGIDLSDKEAKEKIYNLYLEAFKKGVYNYIKNEYNPKRHVLTKRQYFSGGIELAGDIAYYPLDTNIARANVNPNDKLIKAVLGSVSEEPVVPEGWTYLAHGTNLLRRQWNDTYASFFDQENFNINESSDLSVITREDQERDAQIGYGTTKNYFTYARPQGMGNEEFAKRNKPVEIRVIFPKNWFNFPNLRAQYLPAISVDKQDQVLYLIKKYYASLRHPVVPKKTVLVKLAQTKGEDGRDIVYYIPADLREVYQKTQIFKLPDALDVVLAAANGHNVAHSAVGRAITDGLPQEARGLTPQEIVVKYRDPDGRVVIPITGLLRASGLMAHIGLGKYYGEPVVYIDAMFTDQDRQRIKNHYQFEIGKWETKRQELGLNHQKMREWIIANSNKGGTGLAQQLAERWHNEANLRPESNVNGIINRNNERVWRSFQSGRAQRALEKVQGAADRNIVQYREIFKRRGVILDRLGDINGIYATVQGVAAMANYQSRQIAIRADLVELLSDDELLWVVGHEYNHLQEDMARYPGNRFGGVDPNTLHRVATRQYNVQEWLRTKIDADNGEDLADEGGVFLTAMAGANPRAGRSSFEKIIKFVEVIRKAPGYPLASMSDPNASHPEDTDRLSNLSDYATLYEKDAVQEIYGENDLVLSAQASGENSDLGGIGFDRSEIKIKSGQKTTFKLLDVFLSRYKIGKGLKINKIIIEDKVDINNFVALAQPQ